MKMKKALTAMLCCTMALTAFAACGKEKAESGKTNNTQQTPSTQTPATPETPVVKTVTAEQWVQIFAAMPSVSNVTVTKVYKYGEDTETYVTKLTGDRVYTKSSMDGDEEEEYYVEENGSTYCYTQSAVGEWNKALSESDIPNNLAELDGLQNIFNTLQSLYASLQFDQTTGVYSATNLSLENVKLAFLSVGFTNGKLVSFSWRDEESGESFTFSNYGTTKITLPDEEEDDGGENLPPQTGEWTEENWALALENLLATSTGTMELCDYVYENGARVDTTQEQVSLSGGTEKYECRDWEGETGYGSRREAYYKNVNGTNYAYEYTGEGWTRYEYGSVEYTFNDLQYEWWWEEGLEQSIPYLSYDGKSSYYAEDFYYDDGEDITFDDISIVVENAKIKSIELNCHNPDWEEYICVMFNYDNVTIDFPDVEDDSTDVPDEGGGSTEEEGGDKSEEKPVEAGVYVFYVCDENYNPLSGYYVQLSTGEICLPPVETDASGYAYVVPATYGLEAAEYTVNIMDYNYDYVRFDGVGTTEAEYGEGEYVLVVLGLTNDSTEEEEPISEAEWNAAFEATSNATDFYWMESYREAAFSQYVTTYVNGGTRGNQYMDISYSDGTYEYEEIYYERIDGCDYVYVYEESVGGYVYCEATLDEAYYTLSGIPELKLISGCYYDMEYQGDGLFIADGIDLGIFYTAGIIEVRITDGYVSRVYMDGYDADGNYCSIGYEIYYEEINFEMPEAIVVEDSISEAEWDKAFEAAFSATDVSWTETHYEATLSWTSNFIVDDGTRGNQYMEISYTDGTYEYEEIYYEHVDGCDHVYEYDDSVGGYVYCEVELGDAYYTLSGIPDLQLISGYYGDMKYNGDGLFFASELDVGFSYIIKDVQVQIVDGYVSEVYMNWFDEDNNYCYVWYQISYGEVEVEMPAVAELPDDSYITNY